MRKLVNPLVAKIAARQAKVGVVGLGYVGLPLGMAFADAGFPVMGIDVDKQKVAKVERGESYIKHIPSAELQRISKEGRLHATTNFAEVSKLDVVVICVPTPLTKTREPDLSFIVQTAEALAPYVRAEQLFVLESTTYPGTTDEVLRPILERGGLKAGVDFHLAFSPEREDPGNRKFNTRTIPKVVGGHTPACLEAAQTLYSAALSETVAVSSTRVAEMTKLLENIFRCVNIALVNELKLLCERMGLDVWEVIDAAATKPFGFMPFYPGPGLGGHCIPIDPFYLTWKAREFELQTRFIELAGEVNAGMPRHVVQRLMDGLNDQKKSLSGAKVLVLGAAYKKDVDDMRESPSLRIITLLKERGAEVEYHDPFVPQLKAEHDFAWNMESVPLDTKSVQARDAVLILTDHTAIDYQMVVANAPLVVDTRNATRKVTQHRERIVTA